jgi:ribonuclease R
MLLANKVVATHIASKQKGQPLPFIYRVHETPSEEKITNLYDTLTSLGISAKKPADKFTPLDMQKILEKIKHTPFANFVEQISLRSMTKALYTTHNLGHFGLAFQNYTHFTSPIRRYPDLIVHRLLKKYAHSEKNQTIEQDKKRLPKMCDWINAQEIKFLEAEREFIKIKQIRFISKKIGEEYSGIITGVLEFGIFVEIADFLLEGLVHVRTLNDDFYIYDPEKHTLTGKDFGKQFRLGDQVKIKVHQVSIKERRIDFLLIN